MRKSNLVAAATLAAGLLVAQGYMQVAAAHGHGGHGGHGGGGGVAHASGRAMSSFVAHSSGHAVARGVAPSGFAVRSGSSGVRIAHGDHRHHGHHHRVALGVLPYVDYGDYDYSYAYDDDCGWLRWKYRQTGSRYWLNRYYACIEG